MNNAGRVLIIPKGTWSNLVSYEMLDLVSLDGVAYLARAASVGQNPSQDTQMNYWQPFGTASQIATTTTPGLVMPDGQTITIDATGLIQANIGISDLNNVTITSIANGQILVYDSTAGAWKNVSLGTAALRNATSSITSGSTDLIESGAVNSLKQTLETQVSTKAGQSLLAPIQTTLVASKPYAIGEQFVYQGLLYKATTAIAQGGTITINGNCELSGDISQQLSNIQSGNETITISVTTGNRYQTGNISFERPFDRAPVVICQLYSSSGGYLFQDFVWVTAATVNGFDYQVYESVANPSSHNVTLRYIAIGL